MGKIYIFGHKKPDTDSIASTIVFTNFLVKKYDKDYKSVQ